MILAVNALRLCKYFFNTCFVKKNLQYQKLTNIFAEIFNKSFYEKSFFTICLIVSVLCG